jgi:hypothetical protein
VARGEITGQKPKQSAERPKRKPGSPRADPGAIEPALHTELTPTSLAKKPPIRGPPTAVFSIATFCIAHGISQSYYFELQNQGLGPDEMRVGRRVFVTFEAAARWRAEREKATEAAE